MTKNLRSHSTPTSKVLRIQTQHPPLRKAVLITLSISIETVHWLLTTARSTTRDPLHPIPYLQPLLKKSRQSKSPNKSYLLKKKKPKTKLLKLSFPRSFLLKNYLLSCFRPLPASMLSHTLTVKRCECKTHLKVWQSWGSSSCPTENSATLPETSRLVLRRLKIRSICSLQKMISSDRSELIKRLW